MEVNYRVKKVSTTTTTTKKKDKEVKEVKEESWFEQKRCHGVLKEKKEKQKATLFFSFTQMMNRVTLSFFFH